MSEDATQDGPGQSIGALGLALVAVSWAAVLIVLTTAGPVMVAFGRLAGAFCLLLPALLRAEVRRELREARPHLLPSALAGALLGLHLLLWIASLRLTTVAASMFLLTSQAVLALLFSHLLLGEPISRRGWGAVGLATAGAALVGGGEILSGRSLWGSLLAVLSAAAFVLYLVLGRRARQEISLLPWLLLLYGWAALCLAPFLVLSSGPSDGSWDRELLLWLALALGPTILGHGLMNYALRRLRIHVVNLVVLAEPFLAILWAGLLLDERIAGLTWPGGLLIVVGCALAVLEERRGNPPVGSAPTR